MDELLQKLITANILTGSGKLSKRSFYLLQQYPELLSQLVTLTFFVEGDIKSSFRERVYCVKHNIKSPILCVVCQSRVPFRKDGINVGFSDVCSQRCNTKNPVRTNKRKQTSLKKYGTELPQQNSEVKERAKQTNIMKYGKHHKNQTHITPVQFDNLTSKNWLYEHHYNQQQSLSNISNQLGVNVTTVQRHLHDVGLETQYYFTSFPEQEIVELLSPHYSIQTNIRDIIPPNELDIYIPDIKLAIEFCGLYWHSEQQGKDKWYHYKKYEKCKQHGIRLITIFSDEWEFKRDIVVSKLLHICNVPHTRRIFARMCNVVNVDLLQKSNFFEEFHIQGNGPGSITIGLIYQDELVSCMTFVRTDFNVFCLNRYATKCQVVGGFSKLLKYFCDNYDWREIVSFADLRWSQGDLYKTTGFMLDKHLPPDYCYSKDGHTRVHKFNYRRKYLPTRLSTFNDTLSERQNCDINNILRIWDCGKLRYVLRNKIAK